MKRRGNFYGRARRALLFILLLSGSGCFLLSVPAISDGLIDSLQVFPALTPAAAIQAAASGPPAAIVILSAGRRIYAPEFGGETADELTLERVRYGAKLARETHLPLLVSGGSTGDDALPLAALMANVLEGDYGITPKWQEARSKTTAENAIFSAGILKSAGISRVILVTHAWHMKRAAATFSANGMTVIAAPTAFYGRPGSRSWRYFVEPNMRAFRNAGYALHEIIGGYWYTLRYGY